jgi:hypothetical protein
MALALSVLAIMLALAVVSGIDATRFVKLIKH